MTLGNFVDFVEKFGLKDPLLLTASTSQAVDPIAQRRVGLFIKAIHKSRRKLLFRCLPRDTLVKIHQMRLVDLSVSRVDDDEHFGGEICTLAIEEDTRYLHLIDLIRMPLLKEVESGQAMLAVNDQKLASGLGQITHGGERSHPLKA